MDNQLFCIPLKDGNLKQYKDFIHEASNSPKWDGEWKKMVKRYNAKNLSVWHKEIAGVDYIFMAFDANKEFNDTAKNWDETSEHPFEHWFKEQVEKMYAANPLDTAAEPVISFDA